MHFSQGPRRPGAAGPPSGTRLYWYYAVVASAAAAVHRLGGDGGALVESTGTPNSANCSLHELPASPSHWHHDPGGPSPSLRFYHSILASFPLLFKLLLVVESFYCYCRDASGTCSNLKPVKFPAPTRRRRGLVRTAADGDWHDATLAMNSDGTRHPLKDTEKNNRDLGTRRILVSSSGTHSGRSRVAAA